MNANTAFSSLCLPAKVYSIVMVAIIIFDLYLGSITHAISNTISLFVGTLLLWTLCAAGMEFAAVSLMVLPVMFFVFLFAIILYDQSLFNTRNKTKSCNTNVCEQSESVLACPSKCPTNRCCNKPVCDCA